MNMNKTVDLNQLHENLKECVADAGFHYISDRPVSKHPDDWYLRIAYGWRMIGGDITEYASWVYNAELGAKGSLHQGHYTWNDREAAGKDYMTRY